MQKGCRDEGNHGLGSLCMVYNTEIRTTSIFQEKRGMDRVLDPPKFKIKAVVLPDFILKYWVHSVFIIQWCWGAMVVITPRFFLLYIRLTNSSFTQIATGWVTGNQSSRRLLQCAQNKSTSARSITYTRLPNRDNHTINLSSAKPAPAL